MSLYTCNISSESKIFFTINKINISDSKCCTWYKMMISQSTGTMYVPVFPVKSITRKSFIDLQYIKRTSLKTFLDKNTDANSPDV